MNQARLLIRLVNLQPTAKEASWRSAWHGSLEMFELSIFNFMSGEVLLCTQVSSRRKFLVLLFVLARSLAVRGGSEGKTESKEVTKFQLGTFVVVPSPLLN